VAAVLASTERVSSRAAEYQQRERERGAPC